MNAFRVLAALLAAAAILAPTASADRPKGAVKLPAAKVQKSGDARCGKVGGEWQPGTKLAGGYFITFKQQAKNWDKLARNRRGKRKKAAQKKAKAFRKLAKQQADDCEELEEDGDEGGSPTPTPTPTASEPMRFQLGGAVAYVVRSIENPGRRAAGATTNLNILKADGSVAKALSSGQAQVGAVQSAPGKLYVFFNRTGYLDGTEASACMFAVVSVGTGVPTCLDKRGSGTDPVNPAERTFLSFHGPAVQFDSKGALIYAVQNGQTTSLSRNLNGAVTDLYSDTLATLSDYRVLSDDSVLFSVSRNGQGFTRRIPATGPAETLQSSAAVFFAPFPDGNVYLGTVVGAGGVPPVGAGGLPRYVPSAYGGPGALDPKAWIGLAGVPGQPAPYNDITPLCPGGPSQPRACSGGAAEWAAFATTDSGKTYGLNGFSDPLTLLQIYPTPARVTSAVVKPVALVAVGNTLVQSGVDATGHYITTAIDTATGTEKTLLGAGNEIKVTDLERDGDAVLFVGLRTGVGAVAGRIGVGGGTPVLGALANQAADVEPVR